MTFHRRGPNTNTLTVATVAAAAASLSTGAQDVESFNAPRIDPGMGPPDIGRPGKYRGTRKPPSQAKRRLLDRRAGRFS